MFKRAFLVVSALAATALLPVSGAVSSDKDHEFFRSIAGSWSGPGEIVAGKYKGTKFICNFKGDTPGARVGVSLDGTCRVGVFSQPMKASIERAGRAYRGTFLDGASGKGLDVVSGNVSGKRVVLGLARNTLRGAMMARLNGNDNMNVTVSVKVDSKMVPVIGMNLKRTDATATGSVKQ